MGKKINLSIDRGSDFVYSFEIRDEFGLLIDLSAFSTNCFFSKHEESNTVYQMTSSSSSQGEVVLSFTRSQSSNSTLDNGDYSWWCRVHDPVNNATSVPVEGRIRFKGRT